MSQTDMTHTDSRPNILVLCMDQWDVHMAQESSCRPSSAWWARG